MSDTNTTSSAAGRKRRSARLAANDSGSVSDVENKPPAKKAKTQASTPSTSSKALKPMATGTKAAGAVAVTRTHTQAQRERLLMPQSELSASSPRAKLKSINSSIPNKKY
ncbi:hypothetical protein D9758_001582 [Tetrapyrgos nigripes]|uniref:Uncharacterized protein n=1 Tax=Tetrapyrgos nigripes TaxID=182062 RepID=A0A8H5LXN4_9AGAR|nr:hypothetical protein D9758_001582 [Tetrapyrgos nigripes]